MDRAWSAIGERLSYRLISDQDVWSEKPNGSQNRGCLLPSTRWKHDPPCPASMVGSAEITRSFMGWLSNCVKSVPRVTSPQFGFLQQF